MNIEGSLGGEMEPRAMLRVKESASHRARIARWSFFKTSVCFINF